MNRDSVKSRMGWIRPIRPAGLLAQNILVLTVGMFIVVRLVDFRAQREMVHHREMIAAKGGGVIMVSQPLDCIELSDVSERIAEKMTADSVHIHGLIIRDLESSQVFEEATRIANSRFPHFGIGRRAAARALRAAGFATTPVAIVVDSAGRIVAMKQITGHPNLIEDLVAVIGASR